MTEANDPGLAAEYGRRYHDLQLLAVNVLTDAARLSWTGTGPDGQPVTGAADWAEFVSLALAGAAANIGGIEAILAGRPGSWEADHVRNLLTSTVGYDGEYLLEHRTEPVVVTLFVDEILFDQGVWQSYEDARQELVRRYEAIGLPAVGYDETVARLDRMTLEQDEQAEAIDLFGRSAGAATRAGLGRLRRGPQGPRRGNGREGEWADRAGRRRRRPRNLPGGAGRDRRLGDRGAVVHRGDQRDSATWRQSVAARPAAASRGDCQDSTPRRNPMTCVGPLLRSHPSELARSRSGRAHQGVPSWITTDSSYRYSRLVPAYSAEGRW